MRPLRIVNLNTWVGSLMRGLTSLVSIEPEGHKHKRYQALLAELRACDPDVITLQECLPLPRFVTDLAQDLGYDCIWRVSNSGVRVLKVGVPKGVGHGEGVAILARRGLGLTGLGTLRLSGRGLVTNWGAFQLGPVRYALAGRVVFGGAPIVVACAHVRYGFPNQRAFDVAWEHLAVDGVVDTPVPPASILKMTRKNRALRDLELDRLQAWLKGLQARERAPLVLGADLNLDPDTPEVRRFTHQLRFANALPAIDPAARTWDPGGNPNVAYGTMHHWPDGALKPLTLRLMAYLDSVPQCPDHVLLSEDLELVDAGVACREPHDGVRASDHYGVWAEIQVAAARGAGAAEGEGPGESAAELEPTG